MLSMQCETSMEILWPLSRPRPHTTEAEWAQAHLDGCPQCMAFFKRDEILGRRLARIEISEPAPVGLQIGVAKRLAEEAVLVSQPLASRPGSLSLPGSQPGNADVAVHLSGLVSRNTANTSNTANTWRRSWRFPIAIAAAIALMITGVHLAGTNAALDRADLFARDFLQVTMTGSSAPDLGQIGSFYEDQLGLAIEPVQLANATVTRAIVCDIEGDRGAMIEYEIAGTRLAHYRIPIEESGLAKDARPLLSRSEQGIQVVRWVDGDFEHALVGSLPADQLVNLAVSGFASGSPRQEQG